MQVTINKKDYTLHFGLKFLEAINKKRGMTYEGMNLGYGGLSLLNSGLAMKDPLALVDVIRAGLVTSKKQPTEGEIEGFLEELCLGDNYDAFYDSVLTNLKKLSFIQKAMNLNL